MEQYDDLEDHLEQVGNPANDQIFEDEDDDEVYQPDLGQQEDLDDDAEDVFAEPAKQPAASPSAAKAVQESPAAGPTDVRAKLAALAKKKRQEAEEGSTKKRGKGDKGDGKSKRKREKDGGKGGEANRPARPVRGAGGSDAGPARGPARRAGDGENGPQGSQDSRELRETEADKNFLDDEGETFPPDEEGDDEEARLAAAPEAEEADEADDAEDNLFGRKNKKKKKETDGQLSAVIDDKIAKMEAAADIDMEAHNDGRPAINKLKMLAEVEDFLAQRKYHELFIASGGLGVLKAWLEPYKDGELPNVRIRSAIISCCKALPIDTARDEIKENLKKSQLGSRIMFLAQCPDETQINKKMAVELVQKWSRPIFFDPEAEAEKKRAREEALRRARTAAQEQSRIRDAAVAQEQEVKNKIKYGQQGYRWHAMIPQTLKLDYVTQPQQESVLSQAAAGMQAGAKKEVDRFAKKMREVVRKQKGSNARAAVPSVEGRNIVLM